MKDVKISVVVPVYNVEHDLWRCVKSILGQTYQNLEIILVDDGSTDHSGKMCDAIAKVNPRIRVIHKENGGLSSARNAGMRAAAGRYLGFVDSDDEVTENMYLELAEVMRQRACDFVMCDYERVLADGTRYKKTLEIEGGFYDKEKIKKQIFPDLIMGRNLDYGPLLSVWHCLYDLEFLRKKNLWFDEQVRWSEDNLFSSCVGYLAESFYYLKGKALYRYYQNPGTITTAYRPGAWKIYKIMNQKLEQFFAEAPENGFEEQLKRHLVYYACVCIGQTGYLTEAERKSQIRRILQDEELKKALKTENLVQGDWKLKLQLSLMRHGCIYMLDRMVGQRKTEGRKVAV